MFCQRAVKMSYAKLSEPSEPKRIGLHIVDQQLPWSTWLGLQASQSLGRYGSACMQIKTTKRNKRILRRFGYVPPFSVSSYLVVDQRAVQMIYGQVSQRESVYTLSLVAVARPGGELETPNLACAWPEGWARFYQRAVKISYAKVSEPSEPTEAK